MIPPPVFTWPFLGTRNPSLKSTIDSEHNETSPFETASAAKTRSLKLSVNSRRVLDAQKAVQARFLQNGEIPRRASSEYHSAQEYICCGPDSPLPSPGKTSCGAKETDGRVFCRTVSKGFSFIAVNSAGQNDEPEMPRIPEVMEQETRSSASRTPRQVEHGSRDSEGDNAVYFHALEEFLRARRPRYQLLPEKITEEPRMRYATGRDGLKVVIVFYDMRSFDEHKDVLERFEASKRVPRLLEVIHLSRQNYYFLVFKSGEYSLAERIKRGHLNAFEKKSILFEVLKALVLLHEQGIVHGNLNPFNILWFKEDFSWKFVCPEVVVRHRNGRQFIKTPNRQRSSYTAPEILRAAENGDNEVCICTALDMWSFGMIAFKLITGKRLCRSESLPRVHAITRGLPHAGSARRIKLVSDAEGRKLLSKLVSPDPSSRPTAFETLIDGFFKASDDTEDDGGSPLEEIRSRLQIISAVVNKNQTETRNTRNDGKARNIAVDICLDYFRRRSNLSDPVHLREGCEAFSITDPCFSNEQPVFLLKIGKSYRLRVALTNCHGRPLQVRKVESIEVSVSDGKTKSLSGKTLTADSGKHEVCALLDLTELDSHQLNNVGPCYGCYGDVRQMYVALKITIKFSVDEDGHPEEITKEIRCKMISTEIPLMIPRLLRMLNKQWRCLPKQTRDVVRVLVGMGKKIVRL